MWNAGKQLIWVLKGLHMRHSHTGEVSSLAQVSKCRTSALGPAESIAYREWVCSLCMHEVKLRHWKPSLFVKAVGFTMNPWVVLWITCLWIHKNKPWGYSLYWWYSYNHDRYLVLVTRCLYNSLVEGSSCFTCKPYPEKLRAVRARTLICRCIYK